MKDSEIYLKAAEAALHNLANGVLADHSNLFEEAVLTGCWDAPGMSKLERTEFRCLLLCFLAASAKSEGR